MVEAAYHVSANTDDWLEAIVPRGVTTGCARDGERTTEDDEDAVDRVRRERFAAGHRKTA